MKYIAAALIVIAALIVAPARAQDADLSFRQSNASFSDTNATTTVTSYTAPRAGSELYGYVASSNAVWKSTRAGTNYWVKIAQSAP